MRTLAAGLAALAVAVLVTWTGAVHSPFGARGFAISDMAQLTAGSSYSRRDSTATEPEGLTAGTPTRERTASASHPATAAPNESPARTASPATALQATAPRSALPPPPPVTRFKPGSRDHAKAIASNIASAEFQDTVSPLARLYFAYFGRYPDFEGLDHYTGRRADGTTLDAIADEFAGSREFEMRYGTLDNAAFVDRVLRNVGAAGASDRAAWIAQLDSGAMTRGQLVIAFSEHDGFRARLSNEVFVALAYTETLRRTPDPDGFRRWVAYLNAGNPRQGVIAGMLEGR